MSRMPSWSEDRLAELSADERRFVDEVLARMRQRVAHRGGSLAVVDGSYGALLFANPELAWHLHDIGRIFKTAAGRGTIPDQLREWGDVIVSVETGDTSILKAHIPDFVAHGGRIAAVRALLEQRDDALTAEEGESADYVRSVLRGEVTDAAYQAMEARLGSRATVEFTAFVTFLHSMSRLGQVAGSADAVSWQEVHDMIDGIETGAQAVPAPTASIY